MANPLMRHARVMLCVSCSGRQAVRVPELHGVLDAETRDWNDGLLPCIFRELNKPLPPGKACTTCSKLSLHLEAERKRHFGVRGDGLTAPAHLQL